MRTPRGVLLHWDPPELVPKRLDGYVLEARQGSQGWEVLDRAVAGSEMQLLVPGLIKVGVGGGHREGPPSSPPALCSTPQTWSHPDLTILTSGCPLHPYLPTAKSFQTGLGVGSAEP